MLMKTKPLVVRPLRLSTAITEQSTRVLDAHDSLAVEQSILFGMYKGKKLVPSQLKGINSEGGMALVLKVLIPRFTRESGKELVDEVMSPKYKQDHEVTRDVRTVTDSDGIEIVIPKMTKSIKQWRNTALVKPLGRLVDGYIDYLGELKPNPLHESPAGNLVQIPTGTNGPAGARNTPPPSIAHKQASMYIAFHMSRQKVITKRISDDVADTTDRVCLKISDDAIHTLRGWLPKPKQASKKSKSDK